MTTHERSGLSKSSLIVGRVNDAANSEGQATTSTCSVGSGLARGIVAVSDRVRTVPHHVHVRVKKTTCNKVRIFVLSPYVEGENKQRRSKTSVRNHMQANAK